MATLRILDSITDRGDPRRAMEDSCGGNRAAAFVIDAATGLGGDFLGMDESDAAWLARFAKDCFEELIVENCPVSKAVRKTNERIGRIVRDALDGRDAESWALPVAAFQMARIEEGHVVTYGLGDCRLFALDAAGGAFDATALPGQLARERETARHALAVSGGLKNRKSLTSDPAVLEELRRERGRYNRAGEPVWTLGVEPGAAEMVVRHEVPLDLPMRGLLCTDGFAALIDQYGRHDTASLVEKAATDGLVPLLTELRRIEQREDPHGIAYPRFKVSDDATAVLFEIV